MFFSLNKKLIYTISTFFLFTSLIFSYSFYLINIDKLQEQQKSATLRNQQYMEQLIENTSLRKALTEIKQQNPHLRLPPELKKLIESSQLTINQEKISQERKKMDEILKSYDARYKTLTDSFKIVTISAALFFLSLLVLWRLINIWVLAPIEKLSKISHKIQSGNYTNRLPLPSQTRFPDEFNKLMQTFNDMLDNIENGIKEIHKTESFLQSIIDSIPDGIRVLDENGTIIIANKEYYRQINSCSNCIGQKCYASSQNRDAPCPHSLFTCPLQEIKEKKAENVKFIQQFAAYPNRHLSVNAAPMVIQDSDSKPRQYIVEAFRDLSEDIRFSHQQKLSSLGFLATAVAHEMKNHLGSIRMITEGLLNKYYCNKPDNNEEKQYLSLIDKQLTECINVPERLLKMAHFAPEEETRFSVTNSIEDVIQLLDYEAKRNGISINFKHPQKDIIVSGNEADFKMMIINLLQNSLKAMSENDELSIKINQTADNAAKIEIKDSGHGITADKLPRIFEPFYTTGNTVLQTGTGLGLAIVKSIVEKLRGTISVKSKPGVGTCFTIKIPRNFEK